MLHHTPVSKDTPLALLLIHPLGADLRFWDEARVLWRGAEPVFACDLRNAGASPKAGHPLTLSEHAADIEALRTALGIDKLVLCGCAVGAMVAVRTASLYPQSVAGLVLVNPGIATSAAARAMLARRAEAVRAGGMAAILPDAVDRAFLAQPRDARYRLYLERFAAQDPQGYALAAEALRDADIESDLTRIACPALIMAGAHDALFPPDIARDIHARLHDSRLVILPEAAHFLPFQAPEPFVVEVAAFLGERIARAR